MRDVGGGAAEERAEVRDPVEQGPVLAGLEGLGGRGDEPLGEEDACEGASRAEIKCADRRLSTLAEVIEQVLAELIDRRAELRTREAEGEAIVSSELRRRCVHQAALWHSLAYWFEARDDDACKEAAKALRTRAFGAAAVGATRNGNSPIGAIVR